MSDRCIIHHALRAVEEDPSACWEYDGDQDCAFIRVLHCWFDFEDGEYRLDGTHIVGHTCMLPENHDGPHEPTPDDQIGISIAGSSQPSQVGEKL